MAPQREPKRLANGKAPTDPLSPSGGHAAAKLKAGPAEGPGLWEGGYRFGSGVWAAAFLPCDRGGHGLHSETLDDSVTRIGSWIGTRLVRLP